MIFFRILEQLNISLLILHIGRHCSLIEYTGENATVINLTVICLSSLLHILVLFHSVIEVFNNHSICVGKLSHKLFIYSLDNLFQRAEFLLFCTGSFRIGRSP